MNQKPIPTTPSELPFLPQFLKLLHTQNPQGQNWYDTPMSSHAFPPNMRMVLEQSFDDGAQPQTLLEATEELVFTALFDRMKTMHLPQMNAVLGDIDDEASDEAWFQFFDHLHAVTKVFTQKMLEDMDEFIEYFIAGTTPEALEKFSAAQAAQASKGGAA